MAALLLLERLSPLERAVFVLRDVFGFSFSEVAAAVGRSEAACRQLASRARRHMAEGRPRFEADRREQEELAGRDGNVLLTMALEVLGGRIQTIRSVINPDKLGHVGPVGDARAVLREANRGR